MNALVAPDKALLGMLENQKQTSRVQPATALVLIVDDDLGMRRILRHLIEQEGFQVLEAANGQEALELYQRHSPDLVLLDAMMPVMDGFTCCRQLCHARQPFPVPVLIVTTLDDEESVDRAFEAGAIDYVTKPLNRAVLRQRVHRLIQQSRLFQQVKQMNKKLETHAQTLNVAIRERTAQLQRALEFESTLKHITDLVRDSLDERTILQTVVEELSCALKLGCCNAAVYDCEQRISHVWYEYTASLPGYQNQMIQMNSSPEIYSQLLQGKLVQFCSLSAQSWRGQVALLASPIQDGKVIGDIWLVSDADRVWNDLEIRLVQQVTNQCAIAIRQARLYQAAQAQVQELESLNQLKDDFLSTVSHELRTPVTNMRMAIQLLELFIQRSQELSLGIPDLSANLTKGSAYLKILRNECNREINLINDLLDLQRLEAGQQIPNLVTLRLQDWLPRVSESFIVRAQARQQTLQINVASSLPPLTIDPLYLQRILTELINNACKYSPAEATIVLSATLAEASTPTICINVTNTGVIIPEQELERIFDKFYRVPEGDRWKQGGTGLGLCLVKQLVELFDGSICVTSEANQTCFRVELPIEEGHGVEQ
jgi:signal transduction histidine kinase/DNA-binding response OmpR family regulator